MDFGDETQLQETMPEDLQPRPAPDSQKDTPPPPYSTLNTPCTATPQPATSTCQADTLESLRARNPVAQPHRKGSPILRPPPHEATADEAALSAAASAIIGIGRALDEQDRRMIVARAIRAIAVAVSTSRSYAAFIAATTAGEHVALMLRESSRDHEPSSRVRERTRHAMRTAANTALDAEAGFTPTGAWPCKIHDTSSSVTPICTYLLSHRITSF